MELSLVCWEWSQREYGKILKSLCFIMHEKNWEFRLKASRLWQNFLNLCAENYSKQKRS